MVVTLGRLDGEILTPQERRVPLGGAREVEVQLGSLGPGAYTAMARIDAGLAARVDFVCEAGGAALADSRSDPERLQKITTATGGFVVGGDGIRDLPVPQSIFVDQSRASKPIAPAWLLSLVAAALLGITWLSARRYGMR
jgi:hypothetical protein